MYYADNLPDVRNIVNNFTGDGVLVIKAKEALLDLTLVAKLLEIKRDYECLINLIAISEKKLKYVIRIQRCDNGKFWD